MGSLRKIKRVKRTLRILCDHLAYEGEDGEVCYPRVGQWVEIRKKTSGRDYAAMLRLATLGDSGGEAVTTAEAIEMFDTMPEMYALLAHKLTDWNWTDLWADEDESGELPQLPPPTGEVLETLDFETDLVYLIDLIMAQEETPKN